MIVLDKKAELYLPWARSPLSLRTISNVVPERKEKPVKYVFLIYAPRSGSTLLSRCMAKYSKNVLLLPEFRLLDRLLKIGESKVRSLSRKDFERLIASDHQFGNLRFSKKDLNEFIGKSMGMGTRKIIDNLIRIYADKIQITPQIVVFKRGDIFRFHGSLQAIFQDIEYIQIIRDVRGVVNSCLSSKAPYLPGGLKMGKDGDILFIVRRWLQNVARGEELAKKGENKVHIIRYEELCHDHDKIIRQAISAIGGDIADGSIADGNTKNILVGDKEAKIHSLVDSAPLLARTYAWQNKLTKWQCTFIEIMAHEKMKKCCYDVKYLNNTGTAEKILVSAVYRIRHIIKNVLYRASWIVFKIRNGKAAIFWLKNHMSKS